MADLPSWAQTWADYYHTTPQAIMANIGLRNPYENQINPDQELMQNWIYQHPGYDINPDTGRRWIDEFVSPTGTAAGDIGMNWVPGPNTGPKNFMERLVSVGAPLALGAMAGYGALGAAGMLGSEALGGGAAGAAAPEAAASSWLPSSVIDTGTMSQIAPLYGAEGMTSAAPWSAAGAGSPWAAYASGAGGGLIPTAVNAGSGWLGNAAGTAGAATPVASTPATSGTSISSQIEKVLGLPAGSLGTAGSAAGSLLGGGSGQSSTGGLLGGLLGAGLGYLDARNQPDNITVTRTMDPKLAPYAYSAAGSANDLMNQQLAGANPLTQAGQTISGLGQLPGWGSLVDTSKSQWDANPWIKQQQDAITNQVTRNFKENVAPAIGGAAVQAGGYGGSRQGIAEGLAASRMNQDLAPTLATLASDAWNSSQNRALAGAQAGANYGLNSQNQYVNNLMNGANLQANGPWNPYTNFSQLLSRFNGNAGAEITPLFTNVGSNMLGGAQLGSAAGGSVNWDELLKNIGGLLGGLFNK